jgi:Ca2+-binding EF-hand superfamily protein
VERVINARIATVAEEIFSNLDADGNGEIDRNEFIKDYVDIKYKLQERKFATEIKLVENSEQRD